MDSPFGGHGETLGRLPNSWLRPTTRRRPFAARHGLLAIQRMMIDLGLFALAAGISLLSALAASELLLHRPYELLQAPEPFAERITELVTLGSVTLVWFVKTGHYTRRMPFWSEARDIIVTIALIALIDCALQYMTKD